MNVLFDEDGAFKTGTVLTDNDASLQIETAHGKRVKLKRAQVLLEFRDPSASTLLELAQQTAADLDNEFLWEVCGDAEFSFVEFAQEYFGHPPSAVEASAILLQLHHSPIYFHRKGRGRFRKAPPEILQAALAGLEKKRQQAEWVDQLKTELQARQLPEALKPLLRQLLYKPDRNRLETKALEAACQEEGLTPVQLLFACGALASSHDYHFDRFLFEQFSEGSQFPAFTLPALPEALPCAEVAAFSIDDATTTEIDDAFSVTPLPEGGWRIGIHIAAPGLGIRPQDSLDAIARRRLSTVYMPGRKMTMLPEAVVELFTLAEGRTCPALSLYLTIGADLALQRHESRIEQVPIVANLRHHDIEPLFNEETLANGGPDFPWKQELTLLWELACVFEAGRGKASANPMQVDYNFQVDWSVIGTDGPGAITIEQRKRGSPLDKLVAELMIVANSTWGELLDQAKIPGLYRAQTGGKVRMTTVAAPHDGLGVNCYAWSSSPLRRYADLVNQWQLIAVLSEQTPAFAPKSPELLGILRDFELTYAAYADFQRQMERYWCLRWLRQQSLTEHSGVVLRENLVRLANIPYTLRVPSLPNLPSGTRVKLALEQIDLLEPNLYARFVAELPPLANEEPLVSDDEAVEAEMNAEPNAPEAAPAS
jgi:exoribonuclease-2